MKLSCSLDMVYENGEYPRVIFRVRRASKSELFRGWVSFQEIPPYPPEMSETVSLERLKGIKSYELRFLNRQS